MQLFFLFILLALLFILCRKITSCLYSFFFTITKSEKVSVGLLAFFLLPGTIIHELAHFFMATILRVPTGKLTVWPTIEKAGVVKTGKLELARTDPFRRTLIGLGPLIVGVMLIFIIGKILFPNLSFILDTKYLILNTLVIYLLFSISSTMFSSKKDLESLLIAGPILILFFVSLQIVGIKILLDDTLIKKINLIISDLNFYLLIAAVIDYLLFFLLAVNVFLWRRIFREK